MISENLHQLLISQNLTLSQLSVLSQIPVETIRNIIYGKSENPRIDTLIAIAQALHISLDTLIFGKISNFISSDSPQYSHHGHELLTRIAQLEADLTFQERCQLKHHSIPCIHADCTFTGTIPYAACSFFQINCAYEKAFLSFKISGNYYAPRFFSGDILLLENRFPSNGEIALFYHQRSLYLRIYLEDHNNYRLCSICGRDQEITMNRMDEFLLIGTYIGVSRM